MIYICNIIQHIYTHIYIYIYIYIIQRIHTHTHTHTHTHMLQYNIHMYIGSDVWILWRVGGAFWIDDVTFECMGPRGVWGGLQECGFWGGGTMTGRDVRDSRHPLDNVGECAGFFFPLFFSCLVGVSWI